jgi:signal transduction histidine kinase
MDAALPAQAAARFHLIEVLQLASEESDPTFDGVARLAGRVVGTPIGLVTFVGEFRQWLRGRFGYNRAYTELVEAFCVQALDSPRLLEVPDATLDPRFANNPLVTAPPYVRFYAGQPIVFEGVILGTVCALDTQPRELTDLDRLVLADLSVLVTMALHARREKWVTSELVGAEAKADRAEMHSREKTNFLKRLSHELRTPLNAVVGFGHLLALDKSAELPVRQRQWIQAICDAGKHLQDLTGDMLNLSQLEAGEMKLNAECVDLRDVLAQCESLIKPDADQAGITVTDDIEPHSAKVIGDRRALAQVLTNLLSNAVKYNRPQGTVKVKSAPAAEDGWIELTVEDTGTGLSELQLKNMFQPFNRLGAENSAVPGSGLGLVITKTMVEAMDGDIACASRQGAGTKMTVRLRQSGV